MAKGKMKMEDRIARAKRHGNAKLVKELERIQRDVQAGGEMLNRIQAETPTPKPIIPEPSEPTIETRVEVPAPDNYIGMPSAEKPAVPVAPSHVTPTPSTPSIERTLQNGLDGTGLVLTPEETEGLSMLLEMSLPEVLKAPIFRQETGGVHPTMLKLWSQYATRVIVKRLKTPMTPEIGLTVATAAIVLPRLEFSKFKPKQNKSFVTPKVQP